MEVKKSKVKVIVLISIIVLAILIVVGVAVNATGSGSGIAKSKTFTDNMDGYYVYFRAVDEAGNVGDWSNAERIWIDTTAPTVTAKESSVTITEGENYQLKDYFSVVANGGNTDVDIVCTINGTEYENTETLTVEGSPYTVRCTANKNGGNSNSNTMQIIVEPSGPPAWDGTIATGFARGDGSEASPYEIETPQQLAYLASTVNSGTKYKDKYFKIVNDLNLGGVQSSDGTWSGEEWTPIGQYSSNYFGGIVDGGNYEISNLYVNMPETNYVGLFGYTCYSDFNNINIVSGYICGAYSVGSIAGYWYNNYHDAINNCSSNCIIICSGNNVGGIVGYACDGGAQGVNLADCSFSGEISGNSNVGGIVGFAETSGNNCYVVDCNISGELRATTSPLGYLIRLFKLSW